MKCATLGIDLAKSVFQLHGVDERGRVVLLSLVSEGAAEGDGERPPTEGTQPIDGAVAGDGQQPGRHRPASRVVGGGVPPCPHEALLGRFLRGGAIAEDRERQPEHPALEAPDEVGGCIGIARPEPGEQRLIRQFSHNRCTQPPWGRHR